MIAGETCQTGQVRVLVLGTFHFAQQDDIDILSPEVQAEIADIVTGMSRFEPTVVAVEHPWHDQETLDGAYRAYLERPADSVGSRNEIAQLGYRLARQVGVTGVRGVDVPMRLWDDSIAVFDKQFPGSRDRLRRKWSVEYPPGPKPEEGVALREQIGAWNTDAPPGLPEFGRFLPLVEGDVYAGALKLRPWYDRNLRIVQNLFRVAESDNDRIVLVIGGSHVRVLRNLLDLTPQLCAVDPRPYLDLPVTTEIGAEAAWRP